MGRPSLGLKYVQVGLREDVLARIDVLVGNGGRAEFVRDAVDAALVQKKNSDVSSGVTKGAAKGRVSDAALRGVSGGVQKKGRDFSGDYPLVLSALGDGVRAVRPLASELGWEVGRLERVLEKMSDAGLVEFSSGAARRV